MPIYEFECRQCGHHFDHLQKMSDADPTVCPSCHAQKLHRMLSAPAFRLAGTGWYETDFKKPGDNQRNLAGDAGAHPATNAGADHAGHADQGAAGTGTNGTSDAATNSTPAAPAVHGGEKRAAVAANN